MTGMAKSLKANVYVDGVLYGPDGSKPSKEVADLITNPNAWDNSEDADGPAFPEGEPSEDWKANELKAYADSNGVDVSKAKNKADVLSAISDAKG